MEYAKPWLSIDEQIERLIVLLLGFVVNTIRPCVLAGERVSLNYETRGSKFGAPASFSLGWWLPCGSGVSGCSVRAQ